MGTITDSIIFPNATNATSYRGVSQFCVWLNG